MKALKWILGIIVVIAAIILIWGAVIPKKFTGEATLVIDRPAMMIYQSVASFQDRVKWDPWVETEPNADVEITTVWENNFVGSEYSWNGQEIGTGMMRVDSLVEGEKIWASLFFGESPKASLVTWNFIPEGEGTKVIWGLEAETAYPIERIIFSLMGKQMKESFEKGLANLKEVMEQKPAIKSHYKDLKKEKMEPFNAIIAYGECNMDQMSETMGMLYATLFEQMGRQKLTFSGMPFSYYHDPSANTEPYKFYAGIPVIEMPKAKGITEPMVFEEQDVLSIIHVGPYDELQFTYEFMMKYIAENNIDASGKILEFYQNDPEEVTPEELMTKIVFLLN